MLRNFTIRPNPLISQNFLNLPDYRGLGLERGAGDDECFGAAQFREKGGEGVNDSAAVEDFLERRGDVLASGILDVGHCEGSIGTELLRLGMSPRGLSRGYWRGSKDGRL